MIKCTSLKLQASSCSSLLPEQHRAHPRGRQFLSFQCQHQHWSLREHQWKQKVSLSCVLCYRKTHFVPNLRVQNDATMETKIFLALIILTQNMFFILFFLSNLSHTVNLSFQGEKNKVLQCSFLLVCPFWPWGSLQMWPSIKFSRRICIHFAMLL